MKNQITFKIYIPIILMTILCSVITLYWYKNNFQNRQTETTVKNSNFETAATVSNESSAGSLINQTVSEVAPPAAAQPIPDVIKRTVPFTPQAPTANWDTLHNEACEEANAIMVAAYFKKIPYTQQLFTAQAVETEINRLTDYQKKTFGYNLDITSAETAQMMNEVYGLNATVENFPSSEELKTLLARGVLVSIPTDGRVLKNPYFKQPGPKYHMVLVTGYEKNYFIVNDSGTKRGQAYHYTYETLKQAAGEWSHTLQAVNRNQKNSIIISQ